MYFTISGREKRNKKNEIHCELIRILIFSNIDSKIGTEDVT